MSHRAFTLVLAGGGARGYAHVGVLRELEHMGLTPAGIALPHGHRRAAAHRVMVGDAEAKGRRVGGLIA